MVLCELNFYKCIWPLWNYAKVFSWLIYVHVVWTLSSNLFSIFLNLWISLFFGILFTLSLYFVSSLIPIFLRLCMCFEARHCCHLFINCQFTASQLNMSLWAKLLLCLNIYQCIWNFCTCFLIVRRSACDFDNIQKFCHFYKVSKGAKIRNRYNQVQLCITILYLLHSVFNSSYSFILIV